MIEGCIQCIVCNSALFGCKTSIIRRLQSIQNSCSSADIEHSQVWANHYSLQPCVIRARLVRPTCAAAHHVQDLYACPQLFQRVSTDMLIGDLQFSQRRCSHFALLTTATVQCRIKAQQGPWQYLAEAPAVRRTTNLTLGSSHRIALNEYCINSVVQLSIAIIATYTYCRLQPKRHQYTVITTVTKL